MCDPPSLRSSPLRLSPARPEHEDVSRSSPSTTKDDAPRSTSPSGTTSGAIGGDASTSTPTAPAGAHSSAPTVGPTKSRFAPLACDTRKSSPCAPAPASRHPSHSSPRKITSRRSTAGASAGDVSVVGVSPPVSSSVASSAGGVYAESAKETSPHGSGRSWRVPSGSRVVALAQRTSSSAAGSRTARQSPPAAASRTHGLNTIGRTTPSKSAGLESPPERTSIEPAKTYSPYGSLGRPGSRGPAPRLHH